MTLPDGPRVEEEGLTESLVRTAFTSQAPAATSFRGVAQIPYVQMCRLSRSDKEEMGGQGMEEELRFGGVHMSTCGTNPTDRSGIAPW